MFIAVLASLAAPAPAAAPPAPPVAQSKAVDPAALAEAKRFLDEQDFEEETIRSANMGLELTIAAMIDQIQKMAGEPVPPDFLAKLKQTMVDHTNSTLRAKMVSIKQQAATIYAQEFTAAEIVHLRELSADPVMVKARQRGKVINPKLMALGAYTMRESEPDLQAKIQALIADYLAREKAGANHS